MSTIKKMSIRGIRSFGPDDGDKQTIDFFQPLTVIQGPNGSGKTTVIECLKFITTGTLPPGSKGGGAFIHDPKIMQKKEVVGQVKLELLDVSGEQCTVERSTVSTPKGNTIMTKTRDCAITRKNSAGEQQDMTSKCANLYKEMITLLGVSKPVLDNVIFCHQEDSNWPLSEGKMLKEKFDAIFASTRYAKALDVIRKLKQEQDMKVRENKATLTILQANKERAAQLKDEISAREESLAASKQTDEEIKEQLVPLETRLGEIATVLSEINKIQTEILKLQSALQEKENSVEETKKSIKTKFKGLDEDLKRELAELQDQIRKMAKTIEKYEQKERELSHDLEKLSKEESNLKLEVGKLEQEAEGNTENIRKRDTLIRHCADKYKFSGFESVDITENKYKRFIDTVNNKLETLNNDRETLKAEYEKKEEDQQKKIDELRDTKTKLEQREKMKRDIVEANKVKIFQIDQKRCEVDTSAQKLDQLKLELRKKEEGLQTVEETVNVEAINKEISDLTEEKLKLESKISQLSLEMNNFHHHSSEQAHLHFLEKEKSTREGKFYRLQAKHEDFISSLLPERLSGNMTEEFTKYIRKQSEEIRCDDAGLHEIKIFLSREEAEMEIIMKQLKKEEAELKVLEERIFSISGGHNFDEGLQKIQQQLSQSQDQKSYLLGEETFFKNCVRDLNKNDPCCPLCHQKFDKEDDIKKLILELGNKSDMISAKLQEAEKDLDEFQNKYDDMMQLRPMQILKTEEIPQLKTNMKKTSEEIDRLKNRIQDLEDKLKVKENKVAAVKSAQHDISMMGFYYEEFQELDAQIKYSKLAGGDSGRLLQEVISEKETLQTKVESLTHQLNLKWQKLSDHMNKVQNLSTSINCSREKILDIEIELQQSKLEEDKTTLLHDNEVHNQEIEDAVSKLKPLQEKIESLRQKKEFLTKEKEEQCEKAKAEIDKVKTEAIKVKDINQVIKSYSQSGKVGMLKQRCASVEEIQGKLMRTSEERKGTAASLDKLRKDLPSQQMREQDLQRNFSLREKKHEIKVMNAQIKKLNEKSSDLDKPKLKMEQDRLVKQTSDLNEKLNVAKGRRMGFTDEICKMKKDLQLDKYANAEEKYRDMMIDLRTTEMVSRDLKKYFDALDNAIMKYHKLKMEEINNIIRDLWRNTYRGNDIETIEICSDVDNEDDRLNTSANPRKTYNYRVVMVKGDTKLDMRGRCSAGQKVLASLIIRLALAETFCLNCGILALDEPTTNLDHENTESLACALLDIIRTRSYQRNFQLLVISHNEDFVDLLGRSDYVEEVYKVSKNQDGYSQLTRSKVCEESQSMRDTQMRGTQRMTDTQVRGTQRLSDRTQMQGTQRMSDTTQMQGTQRMSDTQMRGTQRLTDTTQMQGTQRMTDSQTRGTQMMTDDVIVID